MSNVNMTVNVDGDGTCCAPVGNMQVRVWYSELAEGKVYGPLSLESAEQLVVAICVRADVVKATIEAAGT